MKTRILKLSTMLLLLLFLGASCQKDEIDYADESIQISSFPNISVYKTNADYFNNISVQITPEGQLNAIPAYTLNDPRIRVDNNGNVNVNFRWRLKSGYIVDKEAYINAVFTGISAEEYVNYNTNHGVAGWPHSLIEPRIIDKNPFTEFYLYNGLNEQPRTYTLGEINNLIENGTLDSVFTKLK